MVSLGGRYGILVSEFSRAMGGREGCWETPDLIMVLTQVLCSAGDWEFEDIYGVGLWIGRVRRGEYKGCKRGDKVGELKWVGPVYINWRNW